MADFYLKNGPSNSLSGGQVNFDGNYPFGGGDKGAYLERTSKCASLPQAVNIFKLADMHGNVWEWCEDYYSPAYYADSAKVDPLCDKEDPKYKDKNYRVKRGGCWASHAENCRAAFRLYGDASNRDYNNGFRVCSVRAR